MPHMTPDDMETIPGVSWTPEEVVRVASPEARDTLLARLRHEGRSVTRQIGAHMRPLPSWVAALPLTFHGTYPPTAGTWSGRPVPMRIAIVEGWSPEGAISPATTLDQIAHAYRTLVQHEVTEERLAAATSGMYGPLVEIFVYRVKIAHGLELRHADAMHQITLTHRVDPNDLTNLGALFRTAHS